MQRSGGAGLAWGISLGLTRAGLWVGCGQEPLAISHWSLLTGPVEMTGFSLHVSLCLTIS